MTVPPKPKNSPGWAPKGPTENKHPRHWLIVGGVVLAAVVAIVVAIVVSHDKGYSKHDSPTYQPPQSSSQSLTRAAVNLAWDTFTPAEQSLACTELNTVGDEEAARRMEQGGGVGTTTDLDWDLAVDILHDKCDALNGV